MHLGALPPAFAGLSTEDSEEAATYLEPFSLAAGETLMEQGEEDYTLAFLVQGAVSFLDGDVRIGGGAARDMIGEVELFGRIPRTASVVASAPTHLLVLSYDSWLELCERGNPAVYNIERFSHRRMGDRLRALSEGIAERAAGAPLPPPPSGGGLITRLSSMFGGKSGAGVDPLDAMTRSPLFSWADPPLLREIAPSWKTERHPARTEICRQGELGEKAYLLVEGEVDLMVATGARTAEPIASLTPGAAFGDSALAQHAPQPASCVARTDVTVLAMSRGHYGALFASDDPAGSVFRQAMLRNLVGQLIASQLRYVELERAMSNRAEEVLRGTPTSTVWRD
jgi:CRP/FNR family transcriptional regulator, cyclic AMP receptor protein